MGLPKITAFLAALSLPASINIQAQRWTYKRDTNTRLYPIPHKHSGVAAARRAAKQRKRNK
ncbi:hypothetical protein ACKLNO_03525 [Neisseriaceae bacterium B1]